MIDVTNNVENKKYKIFRNKWFYIALAAVVIVLAVSLTVYFNSAHYIVKKLSSDVWYITEDSIPPEKEDYAPLGNSFSLSDFTEYIESMDFYSTGIVSVGTVRICNYYNPHNQRMTDKSNEAWSLSEDKTLCFDGKVYKWKRDWRLSGNRLIIGENEYYLK